MEKGNPWGNLGKINSGNNKSLNDEFKDLLLVLPKNIGIDTTKSDFENIQKLGKHFLNLLERYNDTSKEFLKSIEVLIGIKNISRFFNNSEKSYINMLLYELRSAFIAFQYNNKIKNSYPVNEKIEKISYAINESKINQEFDIENLEIINKEAIEIIELNKTREIPLSFMIKIPFESGQIFWVLYERKGNITYENLQKIKKDSRNKTYEDIDLFDIKDTFITIFFGEKEPSDIKVKTTEERHKNSINSPIFRDEIGTIVMYAAGHFESILEHTLKNDFQKIKALIILGLAPVILRKEKVEEIYELYGYKNKNGNNKSGVLKSENKNQKDIRSYPYENSGKTYIEGLMENEDIEEENKRVIHKRLLPLTKSDKGDYNGAKPSNKAKEVAKNLGFELKMGIGFPKLEKCIYPEKIDELNKNLGVDNIFDAIEILKSRGEEVYLRYETIVIPSAKKENETDVSETVKATVGKIIKK